MSWDSVNLTTTDWSVSAEVSTTFDELAGQSTSYGRSSGLLNGYVKAGYVEDGYILPRVWVTVSHVSGSWS